MKKKQFITTLRYCRFSACFYSSINKPIVLIIFCMILLGTSLVNAQDNGNTEYDRANAAYAQENYPEALKWFKKAAEKGDEYAMIRIGIMYQYGTGVQQDYKEAVEWYLKAVDKGSVLAMFWIGEMYFEGKGLPQNYASAFDWYKRSAEKEYDDAMYMVGEMLDEGQGVTQNKAEALNWYNKAADKGHKRAKEKIKLLQSQDSGEEELQKGFKAFEQNENVDAMNWFKKSAAKGNSSAMSWIALSYYFGQGVPKNYSEAMYWGKKSADFGNPSSMFIIGEMFAEGKGVEQNKTEAMVWYKKAADKGYKRAKERLNQLQVHNNHNTNPDNPIIPQMPKSESYDCATLQWRYTSVKDNLQHAEEHYSNLSQSGSLLASSQARIVREIRNQKESIEQEARINGCLLQ